MIAIESFGPLPVFVAGALAATLVLYCCALGPARQDLEHARRRSRKLASDVVALNVELACVRTERTCALQRGRELQSTIAEARDNLTWALARAGDVERELTRTLATIEHLKHIERSGRARIRAGSAGSPGRVVRIGK